MAQLTPPAPDHKSTVRRMFEEVINLGKIDVVDDLFHPDFQTTTQQGTFDRDGFKQFVSAWRGGLPDIVCEVSDPIVEGDRVAWSVRARGTHTGDFMGMPATGRSVDFDSLNIAEFRDGLAYRHTAIMDVGRMMEQLTGGAAAS